MIWINDAPKIALGKNETRFLREAAGVLLPQQPMWNLSDVANLCTLSPSMDFEQQRQKMDSRALASDGICTQSPLMDFEEQCQEKRLEEKSTRPHGGQRMRSFFRDRRGTFRSWRPFARTLPRWIFRKSGKKRR